MHRLAPILLLSLASLAGCLGGGGGGDGGGPPADPSTGSIFGLVVDQKVAPVGGVFVALAGTDLNRTTDERGLFNFTGLEPGSYVVTAGKPGFTQAQTTTEVVGGVPNPPLVKVLLERLVTAQPYVETFKLDGYYECAEALPFVVDTCDFAYRTAWQEMNDSGTPPPGPRSAFAYYNTQEIDVPADVFSIVQEGFWEDETIPALWIMVDEWPIDAGCDCSDTFGGADTGKPAYHRIDRYALDGTENTEWTPAGFADASEKPFPAGERVVARGFLPPTESPSPENTDPNSWYSIAQNFRFVILTSIFHNYRAPEGWTYETQDQYPVG